MSVKQCSDAVRQQLDEEARISRPTRFSVLPAADGCAPSLHPGAFYWIRPKVDGGAGQWRRFWMVARAGGECRHPSDVPGFLICGYDGQQSADLFEIGPRVAEPPQGTPDGVPLQAEPNPNGLTMGEMIEFHPHVDTSIRPLPTHDPATCWWCLNQGPRLAMERSGMEFSETHGPNPINNYDMYRKVK